MGVSVVEVGRQTQERLNSRAIENRYQATDAPYRDCGAVVVLVEGRDAAAGLEAGRLSWLGGGRQTFPAACQPTTTAPADIQGCRRRMNRSGYPPFSRIPNQNPAVGGNVSR